MALYKLTISNTYGSSGYADAVKVKNESAFVLGFYGGDQSSDDINQFFQSAEATKDYSIMITKKSFGNSFSTNISDILLFGFSTYSIGHFFYIDENGKLTYKTMYTNKPETITVSDILSTFCNKTSSRLGGVIRRVKNRISNLCENRMEVAYGVV